MKTKGKALTSCRINDLGDAREQLEMGERDIQKHAHAAPSETYYDRWLRAINMRLIDKPSLQRVVDAWDSEHILR